MRLMNFCSLLRLIALTTLSVAVFAPRPAHATPILYTIPNTTLSFVGNGAGALTFSAMISGNFTFDPSTTTLSQSNITLSGGSLFDGSYNLEQSWTYFDILVHDAASDYLLLEFGPDLTSSSPIIDYAQLTYPIPNGSRASIASPINVPLTLPSVPEPPSLSLFGSGLFGLLLVAGWEWRRRRKPEQTSIA
jgi:hypothetical protein